MKKTLLFIFTLFFLGSSNAQIGTAPDFTVTDINGNRHNLYEILDSGKIVILDVYATWCPPCWSSHQNHTLADVYEKYGPEGSDLVEVIFYEGDAGTLADALNGTATDGSTLGDWVTDTPYPMINEAPISLSLQIYAPEGFPTVNVIRPSDREIIADVYDRNANQIGDLLDDLIESEQLSTSVKDNSLAVEFDIFPNPTSESLTISTDLAISQVRVMNLLGQTIKTFNNESAQLNVSDLSEGVYLLEFTTVDNLTAVKKFSKH